MDRLHGGAGGDAELLAKVSRHVGRDHSELVGKLSRDDVPAMAEDV